MTTDKKGREVPDYRAAAPERTHRYVYTERGLSREEADAFVEAKRREAEAKMQGKSLRKPKMGTDIGRYKEEKARYEAEKKAAAEEKAYWDAVKAEQDKVLLAEREEQRRKMEAQIDAAQEKLAEDKRRAAERAAEQERVGTHAVNPKIKGKWDKAPKAVGNAHAVTLEDGTVLRGHYVLTEAGAATASHDAENGFEQTEGFPVDENGGSVNDRDYKRDTDAQRRVREMADSYDGRALQSPVIVSGDGIVLSGNNRTMSGDLAARQGTDGAYVEQLKEYGAMYGFSPGQIDMMEHPRVVFVPDEALPYDAATFARFNAQDKKSQSKPEHAVKLGKVVPDNVFSAIVGDISRYDRLSDYYADEAAANRALSLLLEAGVINEMELPALRTGSSLSAAGRELIENVLIGKVFQSSPDAVREIISTPVLRQSVTLALSEIAHNRAFAASGYDLGAELGAAVDLVYRARTAHPGIYRDGVPVSPYGRQQGLFDEEYGDSRVTDPTVLLLADVLNSGKPSDLRKVFALYNRDAEAPASGQTDMFSGGLRSKEDILKDVNEYFKDATPKEQQATVDAAIAERKQRAEEAVEAADTDGRGEGSADGQERDGRGGGQRQSDLAETEGIRLSDEVDENGRQFVLTPEGELAFGEIGAESGLTPAPILLSEGLITNHATNDGYGLAHIEARHGEQIRKAGYSSVVKFIETVAKNYDTIKEGNTRDGHPTYRLQLTDSHNNTLMVELSGDGTYWNINTAGIFKTTYGKKNKEVYSRHTTAKQSAETAGTSQAAEQGGTQASSRMKVPTPSGGKVTNNQSTLQGNDEKSSESKGVPPLSEKIEAASAEVNTEPAQTEKAEKAGKAGTRKSGYVRGEWSSDSDAGEMKERKRYLERALDNGTAESAEVFPEAAEIAAAHAALLAKVDAGEITLEQAEAEWGKVMAGYADYSRRVSEVYDELHDLREAEIFAAEKKRRAEKAAEKKRRAAERDGKYGGFLKGRSALRAASAEKALGQVVDFGAEGKMTVGEYVEKHHAAGDLTFEKKLFAQPYPRRWNAMSGAEQRKWEETHKPKEDYTVNGTFLGKTAYEYAEYLSRNDGPGKGGQSEKGAERAAVAKAAAAKENAAKENAAKENAPKAESAKNESAKGETPKAGTEEKGGTGAKAGKNPSGNRIVTDERYEELKKRMRAKLRGQLNVGVDPEILAIGLEMAAYHIEKGARAFSEYAKAMIADLGDAVRPYIKAFYNGARDMPEMAEYAGEMTPYEEVRAFDTANFDKPRKDVFAQAEMVAAEHKAERDAGKAKAEAAGAAKATEETAPAKAETGTDGKSETGETAAAGNGWAKLSAAEEEEIAKKLDEDPELEALRDKLGDIEEEWEKRIEDYLAEHYPNGFDGTRSRTAEQQALHDAERKAAREDAVLKKMREQADAEYDAADAELSAATERREEFYRKEAAGKSAEKETAAESGAGIARESGESEESKGSKENKPSPAGKGEAESAGKKRAAKKPKGKAGADEEISDAGEKIGGARKDKFAEMAERAAKAQGESDETLSAFIAKTPLSKIFGFDLAKMREGGAGNAAVSFIAAAKGLVPAKPRTGWKLRRWVGNVLSLYRACLSAFADGGSVEKLLAECGDELKRRYDAYMAVGGYDGGLNTGTAGLQQFPEDSGAGTYGKDGEWISHDGWWYVSHAGKYTDVYRTREEAVAALRAFAGESVSAADGKRKEIMFSVYRNLKSGVYFITPSGKSGVVVQSGFESAEDAFKYVRDHNAELQELYRGMMDSTKVKLGENRERKGRDWRAGRDVGAEEFLRAFGFRGVEFGNWMKQEDRRKALNECYDALMDLADVCGVSPLALSLGGRLGMAFGARGGGNANAHYEPGKEVINLTKTKGAGSLAHEWFHAVDNYFAKSGGAEGYATSNDGISPRARAVSRGGRPAYWSDAERRFLSEEEYKEILAKHSVRAEMAAAWRHLSETMQASGYGKRSSAYAELHSSSYWKQPTEMGARAFSVWVENQLSKRDATNDYLANNPKLFEEALSESDKRFSPYPFDTDAEWMDEAFGNLFGVMEEKVDEETGHHVLYQKSEGAAPVSREERVLRDALDERLREGGMEVIDDAAEGQRVLDRANGNGVRTMSFGEPYDYGRYPLGRVEPELANKEVSVVEADANHGFSNYKEAKAWAKENVSGTYGNEETGGKGEVRISNGAVDKFLSESAVGKSESKDVHLAVLKVLPEVLKASIDVETHPDFLKGENGKRSAENGMNKGVLVHRLYGAVNIDANTYRVKITLKEDPRDVNFPHVTHSYEATKIELLAGPWENQEGPSPNTNNSIMGAKLLGNVGMSYNPSEKVLDASRKRGEETRQKKDSGGKKPDAKTTDRVRYFRTADGEAYGFTADGKIYYDPRIATSETLVHEYAHLWASALRAGNAKEWLNVVALMKGTAVWEEVKRLYPELKTDDEIADEVLAHYSGRRGAERLRAEAERIAAGRGGVLGKADALSALEGVKRALEKFWKGVCDMLHIHYTSAEEVADRVMKDLLDGVDPRKFGREDGLRYQFAGERGAAAADRAEEVTTRLDNLNVARGMETAGKDAKAVKMATGWERGADGKWRYEMPDIEYVPTGDADLRRRVRMQPWGKELEELSDRIFDGETLTEAEAERFEELAAKSEEIGKLYREQDKKFLADYVRADELFKAYPKLRAVNVEFVNRDASAGGSYSEKENTIYVNYNSLVSSEEVLAHEIQHAIQHIEGFARGGNVEVFDAAKRTIANVRKAVDEGLDKAAGLCSVPTVNEWLSSLDGETLRSLMAERLEHARQHKNFPLSYVYLDHAGYSTADRELLVAKLDKANELIAEQEKIFGGKRDWDSYALYKSLAGEVESRNVQKRMRMTDAERRASLASETEDVSREDQIFLFGDGGETASATGVAADESAEEEAEKFRDGEAERAAEAGEEMQRAKADRVNGLSGRLNTPVRIISTEEEMAGLPSERQRRAKGWFDTRTGEVTIVLPNNADAADAENTFLHEVVGHDGLRMLFPEKGQLEGALDELYRRSGAGIRSRIDAETEKMFAEEVARIMERKRREHEARGENARASYYTDLADAHLEAGKKREQMRRTATEEYAADLAGSIGFDGFEKMGAEERSFWGRLKAVLRNALRRLSAALGIKSGREWTDKEWAYMLHEAYKRKKNGGRPGVFDLADTVAMRERTGFGETRSEEGIDKVNSRFNEQLGTLTEENADKVVLSLGRPSSVLRSAGVEDKPMKLYGNKVTKKMRKHGFSLNELRDLPRAVADPIAVFDNYGKDGNRSILTELRTRQGNFLVSINIGKDGDVDFNIVRSVFGKGDNNIVDWINRGMATYINKEKALTFLSHQSAPIAATAANAELSSAAKVVENFENPKERDEKNVDGGDIMFRDGNGVEYRKALARDVYEQRVSRGMYQMREALQDSMLGLREAMDAVLGAEGSGKTHVEDIAGYENAYLGENRLSSVNQAECAEFASTFFARFCATKLQKSGRKCTKIDSFWGENACCNMP